MGNNSRMKSLDHVSRDVVHHVSGDVVISGGGLRLLWFNCFETNFKYIVCDFVFFKPLCKPVFPTFTQSSAPYLHPNLCFLPSRRPVFPPSPRPVSFPPNRFEFGGKHMFWQAPPAQSPRRSANVYTVGTKSVERGGNTGCKIQI